MTYWNEMWRLGALALILGIPGLTGCDGDTETEQNDEKGTDLDDGCEETVTLLSDLDEVSPTGYSGQQLLDVVTSSGPLTLTWADPEDEGWSVVTNATPGPVGLEFGAAYGGGEVRFVDSEPKPPGPGAQPSIYINCPDRLEVEVQFTVNTADGLFAETFETTLRHSIGEEDGSSLTPVMRVHLDLDMDALNGSFEVAEEQPSEPESLAFTLDGAFPLIEVEEAVPNGEVTALGTWSHDGGVVSAAIYQMAVW
ncbi:MAG: hypothetical protein ACPHRO_09765 [Nannocystaceae bacterium]